MGTIVIGKVESGCCKKGESLLIMPNKVTDILLVNMSLTQNLPQREVKVEQIWSDDIEVTAVTSGENIKAKVKGISDDELSPGFVLCSLTNPIRTGKVFDAQVVMLDLKSIVCAGFSCIMHLQAMSEEVSLSFRKEKMLINMHSGEN